MIQSFREKMSGVVATALIILIAIPLAFFGVDSLFINSTRVVDIGEVNGIKISELDFERTVVVRTNQLASLLGENYNPDLIDPDTVRATALNDLVIQKLFESEANDSDLDVSDTNIANLLLNAESFQMGGEFSEALYRNYLTQMGYTSAEFMDTYRKQLATQQLSSAISSSGFSTNLSVDQIAAVNYETRSYQYLRIPVETVLEAVEVSEDEVLEYYQSNEEIFQQPEMLSVDYLRLHRDQFIGQIEVDASEVVERFELLQAAQPTQREVAHILVETSPESAARVEEIQTRIDAGEDFDSLAQELSDDIGSSSNGGYLGMTSGETFPFEFEMAAAELEVGDVSQAVQTEVGFHFIKLISIQQSTLELESEYAGIELEVKREKAEELYVEALEEFREASLSTDDLSQLIEDMSTYLSMEVESTEPFDANFGTGIAANAQVRAVAFGPIVKEDELNSEAIELSDFEAVVVHLKDYFEAGTAPLEMVQEEISETLRIDKANAILDEKAQALTKEIAEGAELEEVARREQLEWQVQIDQSRLASDVVGRQVFEVALSEELPLTGNLEQSEGGYLVYQIEEATRGSIENFSLSEQRQLRQQLGSQSATAEFNAYAETLRQDAKINIKLDYDI